MGLTDDHTLVHDCGLQVVLDALQCSTRIAILLRLAPEESYVSALSQSLNISMPLLSNHLRVLRDAGLVRFTERAQRHAYRVTDRVVVAHSARGYDLRVRCADESEISISIPSNAPYARVIGTFGLSTLG